MYAERLLLRAETPCAGNGIHKRAKRRRWPTEFRPFQFYSVR